MVHTFIIGKKINRTTALKIKRSLRRLKTIKKSGAKWLLKTTELWKYGFDDIQLLRYCVGGNSFVYFIRIIVNPSVVLFGYGHIGVVRYDEIIDYNLEMKINSLFKRKLKVDFKFRDWSTRRQDYAFDYLTGYVEETLRLFHKGRGIHNFNLQDYPANESYYATSKTVTLNLYNKHNQIEKEYSKGKQFITQQQINMTKNILRLEVQCKADKIKYLKNKYGLSDSNPMNMLRPEIVTEVISYYCSNIIGECNFYSYKEAKRIILNSNYKERIKLKLTLILKLIAKSNSIDKAEEKFISGKAYIKHYGKPVLISGCSNTFKKYLKSLTDLGVNPITIPRDWNIDFIENPIKHIQELVLNYPLAEAK